MVKRLDFASSDQRSKRNEFAPTAGIFVEKARQIADDVVRSTAGSLCSERQVVGTILAADSSVACKNWRTDTFCNTIVLFCDNYAIDIKAEGFGDVRCSGLTFLPDLVEYLHARCPCQLEPKKKKKRDAEGKFVDVEITTNHTVTKTSPNSSRW